MSFTEIVSTYFLIGGIVTIFMVAQAVCRRSPNIHVILTYGSWRDFVFMLMLSGVFWLAFAVMMLRDKLKSLDLIKKSDEELRQEASVKQQQDTLANLRDCPPQCGRYAFYRSIDNFARKPAAIFKFESRQMLPIFLNNKLVHNECESNQEKAILNWLNRRDDDLLYFAEVPFEWDRFVYSLLELAKENSGSCMCLACHTEYPMSEIEYREERPIKSWIFATLNCPDGHALCRVPLMHLNFG